MCRLRLFYSDQDHSSLFAFCWSANFLRYVAISLKTNFVTTSDSKLGDTWTARIRADPHQTSSPVLASFIFYVYNEGVGEMAFVTSKRNTIEELYGHTPEVYTVQLQDLSLCEHATISSLLEFCCVVTYMYNLGT